MIWKALFGCLLLFHLSSGGFPYIDATVGRPWPQPQNELPGSGQLAISYDTFSFSATDFSCDILLNAFQRYFDILFNPARKQSAIWKKNNNDLRSNEIPRARADYTIFNQLNVTVLTECEDYPHLNMDEQYEIKIGPPDYPTEATLVAQSIWGALRGLETFSQLAVPDSVDPSTLVFNSTQILDYPSYSHRGLMLDTSRHYLPVSIIQDNLDLMAMNKFNVFHWHIVDDQSFPYQSAVYPELSDMGAWSPIHVYTEEDISNIVEYARQRGIRVIAEFDTPGHTLSWGVSQPGLLTECYTAGVPNGNFGPIDPSNEDNYVFLSNLFGEIATRFPDHYTHLGGDEVPFACWRSNPDISDFMDRLNITDDYSKLEQYYFTRLIDIVENFPTHNGYMVWEEVFDNGVQIASDTVVHVWKFEDLPDLYLPELDRVTKAGFQALLSSCWYLNYISYGRDWQKYYNCDPRGFGGTPAQNQLVLGGEACMWGEYVDETNVIPRTWPRASAVAERLWSSAVITTADAAAPRLEEHRCRLFSRGYPVEPFGPSFCQGVL